MSFLTAEWRKLAFANYEIDPEILKPLAPYGTELDLREGICFVSLIGFKFMNVRLKGFKIPFHVNFEEVNLRFYVKRIEGGREKRGTVFVREYVPKPGITIVANAVYGENYETLPMRHTWNFTKDFLHAKYEWKKQGRWNSFSVTSAPEAEELERGSEAEFITEHYWGYSKKGPESSNEYEVTHPRWKSYAIRDCKINVDFERNYGARFAFLDHASPSSVLFMEGSEITIEGRRRIKR